MRKYLVDYRLYGSDDFGIVWANSFLEAKEWVEQNLKAKVLKISLRDYNNERDGKELVLWKEGE